MRNVPENIKEELKARGIVPGAKCESAFTNTPPFIVPPSEQWYVNDNNVLTGKFDNGFNRFLKYDGAYATVITPAPQEEEGLKEGMWCEPDEHMLRAILAKGKEVGIVEDESYGMGVAYRADCEVLQDVGSKLAASLGFDKPVTPGEFYDRLCRMAKKPKPEPPIMIQSEGNTYPVNFNKGSVKIGCTVVSNETVRAIAGKLVD